ncbi:MAG TPA: TonB-dependent receptor [Candidatus Deferrimicrobium sp.]|nr:TonB-dependent receptor [Candidatus Deferrimicrobium sp.]
MKHLLILGLTMVMSLATAFASDLTGTVVSAEDGSAIAGATVVSGADRGPVTTDRDGHFVLNNVGGNVAVSVSHVGFVTRNGVILDPAGDNRITMTPAVSVLNSVVVTANRYEKEAYKVSQPITTATAEEISAKGHTIVSDIIRRFPGVDMNDAGPFRARPVIRGLYGTRILVLIDGERLNDQRDITDFAGVSLSLVDPNEIHRVEVVNGPSSVLYGSDAMGGVINIISKKDSYSGRLTPSGRYSGRYSTADRQSSNRIDLGLESEKISLSAGFQYREADRDFAPPDGWQTDDARYNVFRPKYYDSLNAARGTDFSNNRLVNSTVRVNNYDGRLGWKVNDKHRLDVDFGAFRGHDIGYPGVPNDSTPYFFFYPRHDRDNFSLTYTGTGLGSRMARLEARLYYENISKDFFTDFMDGIKIFAGPPPNPPTITPLTSTSTTEVKKLGLNFQELYRLSDNTAFTFGFDAVREKIDGRVISATHFQGFGPFPFTVTDTGSSVPENRWFALGAYISGELNVEGLQVVPGVRFDNFWVTTERTPGYVDDNDSLLPTADEQYSALNGSLGLVYPVGGGVNAVANVGSAYRVPNVVERFYFGTASGRETRPNPDIDPERSVSVDFGIKAVHPQVNYSLIGFYSDFSNFSQLRMFGTDTATFQPLWRYENIEDVTISGFEAMIEGQLENGLYGSLAFSYQHGNSVINDTIDQPIFVSPIKTDISIGYRHRRHGLFGEISLRRVENQDRVPQTTALDDIPSKGYTTVGAAAGIKLWDRLRLTISGNNLFDEVYSEPFNGRNPDNPIPEPGRNVIVSIGAEL